MHESEKWKGSRSVVSDSSWPHGLQPTRLLHPWDFPGKSTGVGCHCLLRWCVSHLQMWSFILLFANTELLLPKPIPILFQELLCSPPPFCLCQWNTSRTPDNLTGFPGPWALRIYLHSCDLCLSHQNLTSSSNSQCPKTLFQIYNPYTMERHSFERQQNDTVSYS